MKKKLLIIGIAVLMLFSLVGCNQGSTDGSGSDSKQSGKVNLLFYDSEHKMFHTEKITINIEEISLLSPNESTNFEGKPVLVIQYMIYNHSPDPVDVLCTWLGHVQVLKDYTPGGALHDLAFAAASPLVFQSGIDTNIEPNKLVTCAETYEIEGRNDVVTLLFTDPEDLEQTIIGEETIKIADYWPPDMWVEMQ
ncbi:DUF5067 domain-containing protein [Akkermansia muciniphila]|uniref:DUF5067 domain-containing protein n=1 Tax=Akkermansia muciniphila TaxID=239935 RepID=UPI001387633E|nr:DUF5067 domain-containing protein [Akkermansia muciniphila]